MIGNTLLNQIVNERGITRPAEVLNQLHDEIRQALKQDDEDAKNRDGMDIVLCVLHRNINVLEFAGRAADRGAGRIPGRALAGSSQPGFRQPGL
jgi:hypothetical protein